MIQQNKIKVTAALVIAVSALFFGNVFAQDIIYLKNSEKIEAKISEITPKEIKYKKHSNLEGPDYTIDRKTVNMIVYENGEHDMLRGNSGGKELEILDNSISFNYGDLAVNRVGFSYERLINEGRAGLKIPVSVSFSQYNYYDPVFQGGFDFNYYPLGQRRLTYYTGIGLKGGMMKRSNYYYDYYYGYYYYGEGEQWYYGAYVNNGLRVHWTKNFSISGQIGLGVRDIEGFRWAEPHVVGELNASIRF